MRCLIVCFFVIAILFPTFSTSTAASTPIKVDGGGSSNVDSPGIMDRLFEIGSLIKQIALLITEIFGNQPPPSGGPTVSPITSQPPPIITPVNSSMGETVTLEPPTKKEKPSAKQQLKNLLLAKAIISNGSKSSSMDQSIINQIIEYLSKHNMLTMDKITKILELLQLLKKLRDELNYFGVIFPQRDIQRFERQVMKRVLLAA